MKARKLLSLALSVTMTLSIFLGSAQAFAEEEEPDSREETIVADQSAEPENDLQSAEQEQPEPIVAGEQEGGMPACTCTVNCGQDSINGGVPPVFCRLQQVCLRAAPMHMRQPLYGGENQPGLPCVFRLGS